MVLLVCDYIFLSKKELQFITRANVSVQKSGGFLNFAWENYHHLNAALYSQITLVKDHLIIEQVVEQTTGQKFQANLDN